MALPQAPASLSLLHNFLSVTIIPDSPTCVPLHLNLVSDLKKKKPIDDITQAFAVTSQIRAGIGVQTQRPTRVSSDILGPLASASLPVSLCLAYAFLPVP